MIGIREKVDTPRKLGFKPRKLTPLLSVLAVGCLSVAGFLVSVPLGFVATGVLLWALEWRFDDSGDGKGRR